MFLLQNSKKVIRLAKYINTNSIIKNFSIIKCLKMSDKPVPSTSATAVETVKKKFMNSATQHGNESNADEENIVIFANSNSPIRETVDEVVWHEEIIYDEDVSTKKIKLPIIFSINRHSQSA
ncbi:hypothetical protein PVAND_006154 [Polypedilum vanderplanki]|uniref:Uncharacterized protein n=1 Tax=Polypedilum vanderplanki TaxID=319348 RepID=A0A9J6C3A9_POLVA|nr:hypothetical protein PVAND_006154 [Polypedilum vanderplanki]